MFLKRLFWVLKYADDRGFFVQPLGASEFNSACVQQDHVRAEKWA